MQNAVAQCGSPERGPRGVGCGRVQTYARYFGVFEKSALERVDLPHTLRKIEYNTFKGCTRLKSIELPERLEYIGKYCFKGSALEGVCLPPLLKTINEYTFCKCEKLRHVTFASEGELAEIGEYCFKESGLEEITLPQGVR